jgi:hypothetical protein
MFTNLFNYLINYKNEKLEITQNSALFEKYITVYNNTILRIIGILYRIKYTPKTNTNIQVTEDCIYY